jgi:hypothetical protein
MSNVLFTDSRFTPPTSQVVAVPANSSPSELAESMALAANDWTELDWADWPGHEQWATCFAVSAGQAQFDFAAAQLQAEVVAKAESAKIQQELTAGYTTEPIAAQTTVPVESRDARVQSVIDALNAETDRLMAQLDAIQASTTVGELNTALEALQ